MSTTSYDPLLEDSVEIGASAARVWEVVSDVRRMHEWSPQVESTRLRDGFDAIEVGAQFTNLNRRGELTWITHGEVVRFAPEREVAFRIGENWTVWSFTVQPLGEDRTRLLQRRETPDGVSPEARHSVDTYFGGPETFTTSMREGMRQTLAGIKATAEG